MFLLKRLGRTRLKWELLIVATFIVTFYWSYDYLISIGGNFQVLSPIRKFSNPLIKRDLEIYNQDNTKNRRFKILFWTKWYRWDPAKSSDFVSPECSPEFEITSDRREFDDADVIVFQYVDLHWAKVTLPDHRNINVPWILTLWEAPVQYPPSAIRTPGLDGVFNWTWSYRMDSLIHPNFSEKYDRYLTPDPDWVYGSEFSKEFLRKKTKLAVWVVSNCVNQPSLRNELVQQLRAHGIQVDTYGKCGKRLNSCERNGCFETLGQSYKFYLALENTLCEDYVTEKPGHGLLHNMVPVVYAMGQVAGVRAPPEKYMSHINVLDFATVGGLADRLKFLDRNPEEYFRYFEWRQFYTLNVTGSARYNCHTYRKMKEYSQKLGTEEDHKYRHSIPNLKQWLGSFYNKRFNKSCNNCLRSRRVNVAKPSRTRNAMYNHPSNCH